MDHTLNSQALRIPSGLYFCYGFADLHHFLDGKPISSHNVTPAARSLYIPADMRLGVIYAV